MDLISSIMYNIHCVLRVCLNCWHAGPLSAHKRASCAVIFGWVMFLSVTVVYLQKCGDEGGCGTKVCTVQLYSDVM